MILDNLLEIKERELAQRKPMTLRCCTAAGCMSTQSGALKEQLVRAVQAAGLEDQIEVRGVGCLRLCCQGPLVAADPSGVLYQRVLPEQAPHLVQAVAEGKSFDLKTCDTSHPFFHCQKPIVLENCGQVDPTRIESYIAADGYQPLRHALREMTPAEVLDTALVFVRKELWKWQK